MFHKNRKQCRYLHHRDTETTEKPCGTSGCVETRMRPERCPAEPARFLPFDSTTSRTDGEKGQPEAGYGTEGNRETREICERPAGPARESVQRRCVYPGEPRYGDANPLNGEEPDVKALPATPFRLFRVFRGSTTSSYRPTLYPLVRRSRAVVPPTLPRFYASTRPPAARCVPPMSADAAEDRRDIPLKTPNSPSSP